MTNDAFRLIDLPQRRDARGLLVFGQTPEHVPFEVRRFFLLCDLAPGQGRGGHAHRRQHQYLVMTAGSCVVEIDDGAGRAAVSLDMPSRALYVPPMHWLDLRDFSAEAACLVLTSDVYDEADYVRDYDEFLSLSKAGSTA